MAVPVLQTVLVRCLFYLLLDLFFSIDISQSHLGRGNLNHISLMPQSQITVSKSGNQQYFNLPTTICHLNLVSFPTNETNRSVYTGIRMFTLRTGPQTQITTKSSHLFTPRAERTRRALPSTGWASKGGKQKPKICQAGMWDMDPQTSE